MFGCIGRLGCLLVLAVGAAIAWFTHDSWYPKVRARFGGAPVTVSTTSPKWEPLTAEGMARARVEITKLSSKNGPVYIDVGAGDLAAYALTAALRDISVDYSGAEALARDDHLSVRAMVNVADLGDSRALGPIASVIGGKQEITVRGKLEVVSPSHAQFVVDEVMIKELKLPGPLVENLVGRVQKEQRTITTPKNAIPFRVPRELGDVRIAKGHVVLYKTVP